MAPARLNVYLDYESAIRVLKETNEALVETTERLNELKTRHDELSGQYEELRARYFQLKQSTLQGLWGYAVENSSDFEEIKSVDGNLVETQNRVGDFNLGEVLGTGQFSTVRALLMKQDISTSGRARRRGAKKQQDKLLAVKIIKKENVSSVDGILSYENEVRTLKEVSAHRNIVDFVQVLHGSENLYIVMEGFKHDLFNFMEQYKDKVDTNISGMILKEVLSGVAHLAQHHMVHRDIKPENILVQVATNDIIVKLCDFGLCKKLEPHVTKISRDFAGSPGFFAPEILTTSTFDPYKADIFSVGCTALDMLTSVEFFSKKWMPSYQVLKDRKEKGNFYFHIREALLTAQDEISLRFSGGVDACVRDFVCSILHMQPSLRPAVTDLLRTKWMSKVDKARGCDILLDRDALYLRHRRFSYIPPRRITQEELDGEFSRKTLLPKGVKVPESKKAGLPSIAQSTQSPQSTTHSPMDRRRSSTLRAVQQLENQNRRNSNFKLKDNGLGSLALDEKERRKVAQTRRASFLIIESEQARSSGQSDKEVGVAACDPSHVPFGGTLSLGALAQALQEKGSEEATPSSPAPAPAPAPASAGADTGGDEWGTFVHLDEEPASSVGGGASVPASYILPCVEAPETPMLKGQSAGLETPEEQMNPQSVASTLVLPEEEEESGLQFSMDLEVPPSIDEGDVTDRECSSSDSSANVSRKPSASSIVV